MPLCPFLLLLLLTESRAEGVGCASEVRPSDVALPHETRFARNLFRAVIESKQCTSTEATNGRNARLRKQDGEGRLSVPVENSPVLSRSKFSTYQSLQ